jgi:hypothetical protein
MYNNNTFTKKCVRATSHFNKRYQLYELASNDPPNVKRKWIFTATGHGRSACDEIGWLSTLICRKEIFIRHA